MHTAVGIHVLLSLHLPQPKQKSWQSVAELPQQWRCDRLKFAYMICTRDQDSVFVKIEEGINGLLFITFIQFVLIKSPIKST
jgi:hypothetical protein